MMSSYISKLYDPPFGSPTNKWQYILMGAMDRVPSTQRILNHGNPMISPTGKRQFSWVETELSFDQTHGPQEAATRQEFSLSGYWDCFIPKKVGILAWPLDLGAMGLQNNYMPPSHFFLTAFSDYKTITESRQNIRIENKKIKIACFCQPEIVPIKLIFYA